jgi:hypothetical protein
LSTIKKLDPRVRRNQYDRKERERNFRLVPLTGDPKSRAALIAALSYQALKRINKDPTKSGRTKDRLARKLDKEILANFPAEDQPEEPKGEQEQTPQT